MLENMTPNEYELVYSNGYHNELRYSAKLTRHEKYVKIIIERNAHKKL